MSMTGVRIRQTVCSSCGNHGRLVIATPEEVISRCPYCGDELRTQTAPIAAVPQPAATPDAPRSLPALRV
jgi:predicted RNA-binding Zn-ribbon protein involved in translation (DUF1610 family)